MPDCCCWFLYGFCCLDCLWITKSVHGSYRYKDCNGPVSKAVPQVPPRDPVLLVDVGHVTTHRIVRFGLWTGIVHNGQDFAVFRGLRYLVPLIRNCNRRVRLGLIRQVEFISTQPVPCGLSLPLCGDCVSIAPSKLDTITYEQQLMDLFIQAESREEKLFVSALCQWAEGDRAHVRRCCEKRKTS